MIVTEVSRTDVCRHARQEELGQARGEELGCEYADVGLDPSEMPGEGPELVWEMRECSPGVYGAAEVLKCSHDRLTGRRVGAGGVRGAGGGAGVGGGRHGDSRNKLKLVIAGSSLQRTAFYDLVCMFDAKSIIDVTLKKHDTMRFSVCWRARGLGRAAEQPGGRGKAWVVVSGIAGVASGGDGAATGAGDRVCSEQSVGQEVSGEGELLALEIVFVWVIPARKGANSSVEEYRDMAETIAGIPRQESLSRGDVLFLGLHPYDIFQRPLSSVSAGVLPPARMSAVQPQCPSIDSDRCRPFRQERASSPRHSRGCLLQAPFLVRMHTRARAPAPTHPHKRTHVYIHVLIHILIYIYMQ